MPKHIFIGVKLEGRDEYRSPCYRVDVVEFTEADDHAACTYVREKLQHGKWSDVPEPKLFRAEPIPIAP